MSAAEPLVLVGAGPLAGEVTAAVEAVNAVDPDRPRFRLLGLVDDDPTSHGAGRFGTRVLGGIDEVADHPGARFVICTGSPRNWWSRTQIVQRLALDPARYATLVHPAATLAADTGIGPGSVVLAGCVATAGVRIGSHVVVMPQVVLTHDDVVEDGVTFGSGVRLGGGVTAERGAYLGAGSLVREYTRIGAWALIGMGALVLTDVPPGQVWVGQPASHLRQVDLPAGLRGEVPG